MGRKILLDEEYFHKALEQCFRSLVGEQMKRFEIINNVDEVKLACKELIYEKKRELCAVINAFDKGVKFVTPRTE